MAFGPVLAARHRRVARTFFAAAFGLRHRDLLLGKLEPHIGIGFGLGDLLARQLPGLDRVEALDALRCVAVGDRLDLERVQLAEIRHLIEGQRGIVQQPHGGCFRHQRCCARHGKISSMLRPPVRAKPDHR